MPATSSARPNARAPRPRSTLAHVEAGGLVEFGLVRAEALGPPVGADARLRELRVEPPSHGVRAVRHGPDREPQRAAVEVAEGVVAALGTDGLHAALPVVPDAIRDADHGPLRARLPAVVPPVARLLGRGLHGLNVVWVRTVADVEWADAERFELCSRERGRRHGVRR